MQSYSFTESPLTFLVDTGAQVSIIKKSALASHVQIDSSRKLTLSGVAHDERFQTLGQAIVVTQLGAAYILQTFQVVSDDFPLSHPGILGADFCKENGVSLDFHDNKLTITEFQHPIEVIDKDQEFIQSHTPPPTPVKDKPFQFNTAHIQATNKQKDYVTIKGRTQQVIKINILNSQKTGLILNDSIPLPEGIFIPNTVVESENNEAYIPILNTNESDIVVLRPSVNLNELDQYVVIDNINPGESSDRISKLIQSLRFDHLNSEEKNSLIPLVTEFNDVFSLPDEKLNPTSFEPFRIRLKDPKPINTKQFRLPEIHKKIVNEQVSDMLDQGIIRESISPFNTPLFVIQKKANPNDPTPPNSSNFRVVFDFRKLNKETILEEFPIPLITDILDSLGHCKYFSLLDCRSAYHQINIHEEDRHLTAFTSPTGKWEFNRIPFGLCNAPSAFQRRIAGLLSGLQDLAAFAYFDDIIVGSPDLPSHVTRLRKVFTRLRQSGLKLKPSKTEFLRKEITFLGHIISENQIKPDETKMDAVKNFPRPRDPKGIKSFLGLVGYFRRFIDNFALLALPLTRLLKKNVPFNWTSEQQKAFEALKNKLLEKPILQIFDPTKPLNVQTDASNYAIACTLTQGPLGEDHPVSYYSRVLNKAETNYSTVEKELLAITYALKMFRPYILGIPFNIITDSKPLSYLFSIKDPTSRLMRMRLLLEEYNYKIIHRSGAKNTVCDALSRYPVIQDHSKCKEIQSIHINKQSKPNSLEQINTYNSFLQEMQKTIIINNNVTEHTGVCPPSVRSKALLLSIDDNLTSSPFTNAPLAQLQKLLKTNPTIGETRHINIATIDYFLLFTQALYKNTDITAAFDALCSLKELAERLNITEIAINRSDLHSLDYEKIRAAIRYIFKGSLIKINIYFNDISYPERQDVHKIISENHDTITSGHSGYFKTYERIKKKFFWRTMKKDIKRYIQGCDSCQRNKKLQKHPKAPLPITTTSTKAFEKIYLDIIEKYPITERGNSVALTIQDDLTKFSLAIPLPNHTAETVANALVYQFIIHYGVPQIIVTDCGREFMSQLLNNVAKLFKIKNVQTLPYRPQSKGALERVHSTFQDFVKHYVNQKHQQDWDLLLPLAAFSYNSSVHTATKYSPFELVFGQNPEIPAANAKPTPRYNYEDYTTSLKHRLYAAQQFAQQHIHDAKLRSKIQYDKNSREILYQPGDKVYLRIETTPIGLASKFQARYEGPYRITETPRGNTVVIQKKNSTLRVHKDRIKPARSSDLPMDPVSQN